ncbi:MAG: Holliday junction resolvase RuvX [bacterium]|nr:Holliday junction resolvase RuvX [bacterium]
MTERVLALDVGDRRIGIAVSDPLGWTAQGLENYTRRDDDLQADIRHILAIAERYKPVRLLFGMPRNMDGSYGMQAQKVQAFADAVLAEWDGDHDFYDERLTTMSAQRVLIDADLSRKRRKQVVDKLAAVIILQGYLDSGAAARKKE